MGTTQPIRDRQELQNFRTYYKDEKPNLRNYALVVLGLNTALRISDLLHLRWNDLYDFEKLCFRDHLLIKEQKTGKRNRIAINEKAREAMEMYFNERNPAEDEFIFSKRTNPYKPLSRSQAYRIVKDDANHTTSEEAVSCHSLRKTFGYFAWQEGVQPALLMDVFNHSSYAITKRYLGIEQDEKDLVYLNINI
ncbi:MAG: tyrosine-type recombinase/integrase [Agathobacter sp.]|nr:tyrosine-type recombinase/integrase [Agathobacter sp.]